MAMLTEDMVVSKARCQTLDNIRKINFWGSDLTDISIIRRMTKLQVASLSVNEIRTLEDFSFCPSLEELYIRKNNLTDISEICHLKSLPNLRVLWLLDNPCAAGDKQYRMTVLRNLPKLQKLDNIVVTDEDLQEASLVGQELFLKSNPSSSLVETNPNLPKLELENIEQASRSNSCKLSANKSPTVRSRSGQKLLSSVELQESDEELHSVRSGSAGQCRTSQPNQSNTNVLQAVLFLVNELGQGDLEILSDAVRNRLDMVTCEDSGRVVLTNGS